MEFKKLAVTATVLVMGLMSNRVEAQPATINGSGYGGPDLAAEAIPQTFNGITADEVASAIKVCVRDGDPARGIKSLAQRMLEQFEPKRAFKRCPDCALLLGTPDVESISRALMDHEILLGVYAYADDQGMWGSALLNGSQVATESRLQIHGYVDSAGKTRNVFLNLAPPKFLPPAGEEMRLGNTGSGYYFRPEQNKIIFTQPQAGDLPIEEFFLGPIRIKFLEQHHIQSYDRFGDVESESLTFDGLTVYAPNRYMQYYNANTHKVLPLKVDLSESVNCLRSELQRSAK